MIESLKWVKAKASGSSGGSCVEIGTTAAGTAAGIRDSKAPERGHLAVTPAVLGDLLSAIRSGRITRLAEKEQRRPPPRMGDRRCSVRRRPAPPGTVLPRDRDHGPAGRLIPAPGSENQRRETLTRSALRVLGRGLPASAVVTLRCGAGRQGR